MTRLHNLILIWPLTLLLAMEGCASSPPMRIFVLGDPPISATIPSAQSDRPVMRLLPVSIIDYLDTRDILRRVGPNEVKASPTGRWAERLSVGLTHALTSALSIRLPDIDIVTDPALAPPARQLLVDVQVFETEPDGKCQLTANWTLSDGNGRLIKRGERSTFIEQAGDSGDAEIASAMTRSVNRLADQIALIERNF